MEGEKKDLCDKLKDNEHKEVHGRTDGERIVGSRQTKSYRQK
jgi:hypothetical protein